MLKSWTLMIAAYIAAAAVAIGLAFWLHAAYSVVIVAVADAAATVVVFAFSLALNNSSWYDPYWSVAPPFIAAFWLLQPGSGGFGPLRHTLVFVLLCVWAARLTYNWASQWKGISHEDWRYVDMHRQYGRLYWPISFLGIHLVPTILVFLGCLALWPALDTGRQPFNWLDAVAGIVAAGAITIEATADLQMRRFRRAAKEAGQIPPGLWSLSRHPNYFGEVLFWWGLFLFALAAEPAYWWVIVGPLAILALFLFASIPLMEKHLLEKMPAYAAYQQHVSPFVPWFPRRQVAPDLQVE